MFFQHKSNSQFYSPNENINKIKILHRHYSKRHGMLVKSKSYSSIGKITLNI